MAAKGDQAKANTPWPQPKLAAERPLTPAELSRLDGERLAPTVAAVLGRLGEYAEQRRRLGRHEAEPLVIGLFGGLGQGKSSVLESVKHKVASRAQIPHFFGSGARNWRITALEASLFRSDDIEHRLFSAVYASSSTVGRFVSLALLALGCWGAYFLHKVYTDHLGSWELIGLALSPILVSLVAPTALLKLLKGFSNTKDGLRKFFSTKDSFAVGLDERKNFAWMTYFGIAPDLIIIDDLDRATVAQQRAVLRAVYKHAMELRCAVIVSMDETSLLRSARDPEAPDELLRKIIKVEVRIPSRQASDALVLTQTIVDQFVELNPDHPLKQAFASAWWVSDVARVAVLLDAIGPRRIKRLVADVAVAATTREINDLWRLSALLRIQTLLQVLPELRFCREGFRRVLQSNDPAEFSKLVDPLAGPTVDKSLAVRIFTGTTDTPAVRAGTIDFILGDEAGFKSTWVEPTLEHVIENGYPLFPGLFAMKGESPYARLRALRTMWRDVSSGGIAAISGEWFSKVFQSQPSLAYTMQTAELGLFEQSYLRVHCATGLTAQERGVLYRHYWSVYLGSTPGEPEARRIARLMMVRTMFGDHEAWQCLHSTEAARRLSEVREHLALSNQLTGLTLCLPPRSFSEYPEAMIRLLLSTSDSSLIDSPMMREMLARLSDPIPTSAVDETAYAKELVRLWPPFVSLDSDPTKIIYQVASNLTALCGVALRTPQKITLPITFETVFSGFWGEQLAPEEWLVALRPLATHPNWRVSKDWPNAWQPLAIRRLTTSPDFLDEFATKIGPSQLETYFWVIARDAEAIDAVFENDSLWQFDDAWYLPWFPIWVQESVALASPNFGIVCLQRVSKFVPTPSSEMEVILQQRIDNSGDDSAQSVLAQWRPASVMPI